MKSKTPPVFSFGNFIIYILLWLLPTAAGLSAQTIDPQALSYPSVCANIPNMNFPNGYNRYTVSFKTAGFAANETFIILLSSDNFTTAIKPKIIPNAQGLPLDTPTSKTLSFEVPADLVGSDSYKLRVQNSAGTITSRDFVNKDFKSSFPIYFLSFSGAFFINNGSTSLSFCSGGSVTLAIDNSDASPLKFPNLKYKWFRNGTVLPNETKSSLSVNQIGDYYVEIDYGPCTDLNTHSQIVKVSQVSGTAAQLSSSGGNPFCAASGSTLLTATAGNSYIWRKDNILIEGANTQTYQTNTAAVYSCDVDFGGCKSTATIDLKPLTTNSSISNVELDKVNYIKEGDRLQVSISSTADAPSYTWYLDDMAISGANQNVLDIAVPGRYKAAVTQTGACSMRDEFSFEIAFEEKYDVEKIPNVLSPNGDGINDSWVIPERYLAGSNTKITIMNSTGEVVFKTDSYDNYNGWPQASIEFSFNPVYYYIITPIGESEKKGSITLLK